MQFSMHTMRFSTYTHVQSVHVQSVHVQYRAFIAVVHFYFRRVPTSCYKGIKDIRGESFIMANCRGRNDACILDVVWSNCIINTLRCVVSYRRGSLGFEPLRLKSMFLYSPSYSPTLIACLPHLAIY